MKYLRTQQSLKLHVDDDLPLNSTRFNYSSSEEFDESKNGIVNSVISWLESILNTLHPRCSNSKKVQRRSYEG